MDAATRWGLPEGFVPVRYPVSYDVKEVVRGVLEPGEPVVATLANEAGTISLIATPQRLITMKSGATGAGVTGFNTKEFPWEGITNLIFQPVSINCKISICYKTTSGGKVETGLRARMGKDAKDDVMPFETAAGEEFFRAIYAIWHHKMMQLQQANL
jgi:hypothetical protein